MIDTLSIFETLKEHSFTEDQAKGIIGALERQEYNAGKKLSSSAEFVTLNNGQMLLKERLGHIEKIMYGGFGIIFVALSYLIFGK